MSVPPVPAPGLRGQVAVVTGGNGGIGLGMARGIAAAGADVAVWARNIAKSERAVEELCAFGVDAVAVACDVADEDEVAAAVTTTVERLGRIDICVANAGVGSIPGAFTDISLDEWRRVTAVNLDGVFLTYRECVRQMIEQDEGGALIAVSSVSAIHGAPMQLAYGAAKAGILAVTRALAVGLARHRIRVNAVLPGWTRTEMSEGGFQNERFHQVTTSRTPIRRWGEPDDLAATAAFLADKSQMFHTGDTLVLDGGYSIF